MFNLLKLVDMKNLNEIAAKIKTGIPVTINPFSYNELESDATVTMLEDTEMYLTSRYKINVALKTFLDQEFVTEALNESGNYMYAYHKDGYYVFSVVKEIKADA